MNFITNNFNIIGILRKKAFKLCSFTVVFLLYTFNLSAQSTTPFSYSQYMNNLTPINPAYSMIGQSGSLTGVVRKQFTGIDGAPSTYLVNANIPLPDMGASAGFIIQNDQIAIEKQMEANFFFAKSIQLDEQNFLAVSVNAGISSYKANYLSIDENNDPLFGTNISETKANLGFGVLLYSDTYYIGLSMPELSLRSLGTASQQSDNYFKNRYYLAGAYIAELNDDFKFKPSALATYASGSTITTNFAGIFYIKDVLGIGASYSTNSLAAFLLDVNIGTIRLGYSYQFGTNSSNLGGFNSAIHEIMLSYRFGEGSSTPKVL
ncbi:PorP/SprF family type IX secretion system membrane protein [Mucilaginibacter sp. X5P1]|uniref:PorP/SprF family type IX secretion system membrane protein n=1 Tax=Mucilaginibacter sp. X5P1 TaxID=2723088 RepID=UPI00161BC181|nr:PorP/SprF family type IX secretion system membrane protein [Mucilaginibacter sp. X5P1]MBB6140183.1 type IX secretion system PorP/SprF family membrane protein [Mucilaginibacter sp. X5P1]